MDTVNIANVLYVQMRMIACCAYMAGYDLKSDQTQTLVYACLAGVAVNQILKKAGIKLGEKVAVKMVEKIPGKVVISINKKILVFREVKVLLLFMIYLCCNYIL